MWPTRVNKKTVAAVMQQQRMEAAVAMSHESPLHMVTRPASVPEPTERPSVIQHTPLSCGIEEASCRPCHDTSNRIKSRNVSSPWQTLSVSLPPPPKLSSDYQKSSSSSSTHHPYSANSSTDVLRSRLQAAPTSAHQNCSSSISIFANRLKGIDRLPPNNGSGENSKGKSNIPEVAHQSSIVQRAADDHTGLVLDLSVKSSSVCNRPDEIEMQEKVKLSNKELDLSTKSGDKQGTSDSKIGFSPLMSLSTMSAKLIEKLRTTPAVKAEPLKTMKVQPMINSSASSKSIDSRSVFRPKSGESSRSANRPVFSVSPRPAQSFDGSSLSNRPSIKTEGGRSSNSHSNSVPSLMPSTASSAVSANCESSPIITSSITGHYAYPHFSTFPYICPPGHLIGNSKPPFMHHGPSFPSSSQYPAAYFPPPSMFGMPPISPHQAAMSQEHYQNSLASYKEMMQRGVFHGSFPSSMYPGYPALDPAQLFPGTHHLRQDQYPSSSIHKP